MNCIDVKENSLFTVGVAVRSTTASVTLTRRGRQITSSGFYFRKQNWRKPEELEKSILGFLTISKAVRSRDAWNLLFSGSSKYEKGLKIRFSGGITVGKSIDFFYLRRRFYRGFSSCSCNRKPSRSKRGRSEGGNRWFLQPYAMIQVPIRIACSECRFWWTVRNNLERVERK